MQPRTVVLAQVLGMALVTACDLESGDPELDGFRAQRLTQGERIDAPSAGGTWLGNGLEDPDVSGLDPAYGLVTDQGLSPVEGLLTTPEGRNVAQYLVECALPEGDFITKSVAGVVVELEGVLGLAPEWKTGACEQDCQEWVTACLLARTNVTGQSVDLWITGSHPNLGLGLSDDYPLLEATFYGNLFEDPKARYVCHGSDEALAAAHANGRTCSGDTAYQCRFETFGSCFQDPRCVVVDGVFPTECAEGTHAQGARYRSLSTFVRIPEGWQGW